MNNVAEKTPVPGPTDEQKTDARNLADTQVDSVICRDYNNEVFFLIICFIYHNHSVHNHSLYYCYTCTGIING